MVRTLEYMPLESAVSTKLAKSMFAMDRLDSIDWISGLCYSYGLTWCV